MQFILFSSRFLQYFDKFFLKDFSLVLSSLRWAYHSFFAYLPETVLRYYYILFDDTMDRSEACFPPSHQLIEELKSARARAPQSTRTRSANSVRTKTKVTQLSASLVLSRIAHLFIRIFQWNCEFFGVHGDHQREASTGPFAASEAIGRLTLQRTTSSWKTRASSRKETTTKLWPF